jgi:thiamine biosynthesis lipoprotein ApbE
VAEAWATATLVAGTAAGMDALLDHDLAGLVIGRDGRILATPAMDHLLQGTSLTIYSKLIYSQNRSFS